MERAQKNARKARKAGASFGLNRFAAYAYTPKKVLQVPFGLSTENSTVLTDILAKDDSLKEAMTGLMAQAKAEGTMVNYDRMTRKFKEFCGSNEYDYPKFSEKAVLHFVIMLDKGKESMSTICQVRPALDLVEKMTGVTTTAFTPTVIMFLKAAKRRAAADKPPVKKAGVLPDDILFRLYPVCMEPHLQELKKADPVRLRTFVGCVIVYFTFCRFNCLSKLRAMDFEDNGTSIQITFRSAKSDQFHNGQMTCLVDNDSIINLVHIVWDYFRLCGFRFGEENGDTSLVNCVVRRTGTGWYADGIKGISYSTATKDV